jgi:hypothetical protein
MSNKVHSIFHNDYITSDEEAEDEFNRESIHNSTDENEEEEVIRAVKRDLDQYLSKTNKIEELKAPKTQKDIADEFESEMNAELDRLVKIEAKSFLSNKENDAIKGSKKSRINQAEEEDTDSEAEVETGVRTTKKRQHFTNDELFYDPEMDDEDQNWINKQRATCHEIKSPKKATQSAANSVPSTEAHIKPNYSDAATDAVLNCPCCMTLLCMDCQRHSKYKTQYRAMFVFNSDIKSDEKLKYPKEKEEENTRKKSRRNKNKNKKENEEAQNSFILEVEQKEDEQIEYEVYRPVQCKECRTEVGVYDEKEELYHFFNVLASHS